MTIKWYAFHLVLVDTVTGTEMLADEQSAPTREPVQPHRENWVG